MDKQIAELEKELSKLKKLKEKFPDLIEETNRWRRKFLVSPSVNSIATHFESSHGCGCCNDSPYYIKPYIEVDGEKIYSKPHQICVGEKSLSHYGEEWYSEWEETLKKYNISQIVIDKVRVEYEKDQSRTDSRYKEDDE